MFPYDVESKIYIKVLLLNRYFESPRTYNSDQKPRVIFELSAAELKVSLKIPHKRIAT
jgi:hypothetical protein